MESTTKSSATLGRNIALTNAYTTIGGERLIAQESSGSIDITYTTGTAETGTALLAQIEFSADKVVWTPETIKASDGTLSANQIKVEGGAGATIYPRKYSFPTTAQYFRLKVKETGVSSNAGTVTIISTFAAGSGQSQNLAAGGGAGGDVVGPASSTDNAIARWDGVTGKLLQDSGVTVSDPVGFNNVITLQGVGGVTIEGGLPIVGAVAGGTVKLIGGESPLIPGAGSGSIEINGGDGGLGDLIYSGEAGGQVSIGGGLGGAVGTAVGGGAGGDVILFGGDGGGTAIDPDNNGQGGQVKIDGGYSPGAAGPVKITGGYSDNKNGGKVSITGGGIASATMKGGAVEITGGGADTSGGAGGDIILTGGSGNGAGLDGRITLEDAQGDLEIDLLPIGTNGISGPYIDFTGRINAANANLITGLQVASANNLTLTYVGNFFQITGTTQINLINSTDWGLGTVIYLQFAGALTVKHNQTASGNFQPILLAGSGDFTTVANTMLTLLWDGTNWQEIARKHP